METSLHDALKAARKCAGMSQAGLADRAGCKQSAISMFERGRTDVLAWEKIVRIAEILGTDIRPYAAHMIPTVHDDGRVLKCCTSFGCERNIPRMIADRLIVRPTFLYAADDGDTFCPECLAKMISRCPNCDRPVKRGNGCSGCGTPYVVCSIPGDASQIATWVTARRREIRETMALNEEFRTDDQG